MAGSNGNKILIYVGGVGIGCLTTNTFDSTNEEIPTTCKDDDGNYTSEAGSNRWTMSGEGNFNPASGFGLADLIDVHKNKELVDVTMRDTTSGGNNLNISGEARLNHLTWDGPLNAVSTFSFEFSGQGEYTVTNT
ncbi:MAG TPA: phage tail tube protein [Cyclobacteriaceae bacterium]|nr:phage tail tube protein [Cyclobacteriaceae bacterium]